MRSKQMILKTFAIALVVMLGGSVVSSASNLKTGGEFRARTETLNRSHWLQSKALGYTLIKAKPHMEWNAHKMADVFIEPQFSRVVGGGGNSGTLGTDQTTQLGLGLHQAYGDLKFCDKSNFRIGRQEVEYAEGNLLGAEDWDNVGRVFDGARLMYDFGKYKIDGLALKLTNGGSFDKSHDDASLYGIYAKWRYNLQFFQEIDAYYFGLTSANAQVGYLNTLGGRLGSEWNNFDYRIEDAFQWAARLQGKSNMFDSEVGYTMHAMSSKFRLAGGFFHGQENFNTLFPNFHGQLGNLDLTSRRNAMGAKAKFESWYKNDTHVTLQYWHLDRVNASKPSFMPDGTVLGNSAATTSKHMGSEIDLTVAHDYNEAVSVAAGGAILVPGHFLEDQAVAGSDENNWWFFASATTHF